MTIRTDFVAIAKTSGNLTIIRLKKLQLVLNGQEKGLNIFFNNVPAKKLSELYVFW